MALPSTQELDDAYTEGAQSQLNEKNPYPWCTALWHQWNFGRVDNAKCYVRRSSIRLRTAGRYALIGAVVGMVVSVSTYYLTH